MNIVGVGTDIIEISRIREAYHEHKERFLEHLFTDKEQSYCLQFKDPVPHLAGRFAAKEAILKAMGTGLQIHNRWLCIEILPDNLGKPEVFLSENLKPLWQHFRFFLSISHAKEYATATVILVE